MFSCLLDMSLGLLHSVPDWVKAGDFGIISTSWGYELVEDKVLRGTLVPALVARLEYYCYCAQPVKALNIADTIQKEMCIRDRIEGQEVYIGTDQNKGTYYAAWEKEGTYYCLLYTSRCV